MEEHPFAQYIRILGKGRNGARALTQEEAYAAMEMVFQYEYEPEQIGAFMMLMRVKEETAAEVAGFAQAIRESIPTQMADAHVAVDWPSYAGKRRQMPWYLLAALTLSRSGYPVFMHGMSREDDRIYTEQVLETLGINPCNTLPQASNHIERYGFAYMDIGFLSPLTAELLDTRDLLGLRSPLHTVARMLNPFKADLSLQSVFHPNYAVIHQQASLLLGDARALAFKGEGGECERIPERACQVYGVSDEKGWQQKWPSMLAPGKYAPETFPDLDHFLNVWEGRVDDPYADMAVTGTMALVLSSLEEGISQADALDLAGALWRARNFGVVREQYA